MKRRDRLENHAFPWLGHLPVADVGVAESRPLLAYVAKRGHIEQAHRHRLSRVFRYAVATERAVLGPAADQRDTLPARQPTNCPTITDPLKVGELLRAMDGFTGILVVHCALKLAPLWFCRPGEIRMAKCAPFGLDGEHPAYIVPPIIRKLRKAEKENPNQTACRTVAPAGSGDLARAALAQRTWALPVFWCAQCQPPYVRWRGECGSDPHRIQAHHHRPRLPPHGAQAAAGAEVEPQALERQLSHKEPGVSGVYNKAQHLPERRKIMQEWADYLDTLKAERQCCEWGEIYIARSRVTRDPSRRIPSMSGVRRLMSR